MRGHKNEKSDEINLMQKFEIKPKGYKKELELYTLEKNLVAGAKKLKFNGRLGYQEMFQMLPFRLTNSQLNVIYSVIKDVEGQQYTFDDLRDQIKHSTSRAKWGILSV